MPCKMEIAKNSLLLKSCCSPLAYEEQALFLAFSGETKDERQGSIWDLSFGEEEEEGHELPWGSGRYAPPPEIF